MTEEQFLKLYMLIEAHNKKAEKMMQSQLDALNSLKWNIRAFLAVMIVSIVVGILF